ncbi:hypothetical protein BAY1663_01623 [Pseudomonas sp. BAY1663]|nr:hypothetical protein BAY1663_01623 [Pseudomonas sp. BAY1663]
MADVGGVPAVGGTRLRWNSESMTPPPPDDGLIWGAFGLFGRAFPLGPVPLPLPSPLAFVGSLWV